MREAIVSAGGVAVIPPRESCTAPRDDPDDEILSVLKACVDAAENRLPQHLSRKTIDRIWNGIKGVYGGKHRPPDAEIFDYGVLFENTDTGEADSH
ncbi:hypothetical protein F4X88_15790 [Candidatus Poribacteria bacterium]|nr:hypothetical protein [Candidatus Poribacteria bacterium]